MCGEFGRYWSMVRGNVWGFWRTVLHSERKCVGNLEDIGPVRGNVWGFWRTVLHGERKCVGILEDSSPL